MTTHNPIEPSDDELVALFAEPNRAGRLLAALDDLPRPKAGDIGRRCAELHNQGRLDLLSLADDPTLTSRKPYEFFEFEYFFDSAIAGLDISPAAMMAFIPAASRRQGSRGLPLSGFKTWCQQDSKRWAAVADAVKAGDAAALPFLDAALQASDDLVLTREILALGDEPRAIAVQALGWMSSTGDLPRERIDLLSQVLDGDDEINSVAVFAALRTAEAVDPALLTELETLLAKAVQSPGPALAKQIALALALFPKLMTRPIVAFILTALEETDPTDNAVVAQIDDGLAAIVRGSHASDAIAFIGRYLARPGHDRSLKDFEDFCHALVGSGHRDRAILNWLLEGNASICIDLTNLLVTDTSEGPPLSAQLDTMALSQRELAYLSRKAVGFLFIKPVSAASILIAVLRLADPALTEVVADLLFDPLLANYPGSVARYLRGIPPDDAAYAGAQQALALDRAYEDDIDVVGQIRELALSEDQKQTRYRLRRDEARRMQKGVKARSIFAGLIRESQILHGAKVRSVVRGLGGGKPNVIETAMHSHGYAWEKARGLFTDPIGVEHQLFRFKAERRPQ